MMLCSLLLFLTLTVFHHSQAHLMNDSTACLPLLVKDNGECACLDGKGTALGGLVCCSAICNSESEGCSVAGEIVYPACVSYDKDTSLVVAGFCPAALWKNFHRLTLPYNDSVCDPSNRTGTLCGSCMANKSVVRTNSEELRRAPDSECHHFCSWLLYIASYLI